MVKITIVTTICSKAEYVMPFRTSGRFMMFVYMQILQVSFIKVWCILMWLTKAGLVLPSTCTYYTFG